MKTIQINFSRIFIPVPRSLKSINKALLIFLALFFIYLLVDILFIKPYMGIDVSTVSKQENGAEDALKSIKKIVAVETKDYSFYSSSISGKQLFVQNSGGQNISSSGPNVSNDMDNFLTLVGIVDGKNKQAVVENKKTEKTYYLSQGDLFDGFAVEEIAANKVILNHDGRKISLSL